MRIPNERVTAFTPLCNPLMEPYVRGHDSKLALVVFALLTGVALACSSDDADPRVSEEPDATHAADVAGDVGDAVDDTTAEDAEPDTPEGDVTVVDVARDAERDVEHDTPSDDDADAAPDVQDTQPDDTDLREDADDVDAPGPEETWVDPATGLMWQRLGATVASSFTWSNRHSTYCEQLSYAGYEDWRLPDIDELRSLIRGCPTTELDLAEGIDESDPALCRIHNGCNRQNSCFTAPDDPDVHSYCLQCGAAPTEEPSACLWPSEIEGPCGRYISDTKEASSTQVVRAIVDFSSGSVTFGNDYEVGVRCVRGTLPPPTVTLSVVDDSGVEIHGAIGGRYDRFAVPTDGCDRPSAGAVAYRQYIVHNASPNARSFRITARLLDGTILAYAAPLNPADPLEHCLAGHRRTEPNVQLSLDGIELPSGGSVWIVVARYEGANARRDYILSVSSEVDHPNEPVPGYVVPGDHAKIATASYTPFGNACRTDDPDDPRCWGAWVTEGMPAGSLTQVALSHSHACGLRPDGSVVCWGSADPATLTPPEGVRFRQLSAGSVGTCGIVDEDSSIVCWGMPSYLDAPPTGRFQQVSVGGLQACAIDDSNNLQCWLTGTPPFNADPAARVPPLGRFLQVSSGDGHACAIRLDGAVLCWGHPTNYGQANPPAGSFTRVSAASETTCAIAADQSIQCWGRWLSSTASAPQYHPPAGQFTELAVGGGAACALRAEGGVTCWSPNALGTLTPPEGVQ